MTGCVYPLAPHGVFWTIQGEGALSGEPMAFVRLAGCSIGCAQCDTDYRVSRRMDLAGIVQAVRDVLPMNSVPQPWVWVTGGEPTDHDVQPLVDGLQAVGCRVALATSGVRRVPEGLDWLSVSPHRWPLVQRRGNEIKVVPGLNGLTWEGIETVDLSEFTHRYVQPMWYRTVNGPELDGAASLESQRQCIDFVKTHPGWKLSLQAHKVWGIA